MSKYGIVPEFKAGLHGGTAITGELGYSRREIAFMGDVLNTTARIEEACKTYEKDLLVSKDLINQLNGMEQYDLQEIGSVKLRGKEQEITLLAVNRSKI